MKLVIAEKPILGRAIADAIPGEGKTENGCIVKGDYTVIWAYGHLLTLKDPEDYDPAFKKWSLKDLPIYFEDWQKKPGDSGDGGTSKAERLEQIGKLLKKADCVIHAGDPDDEGQYLIDEILKWHNYTGPVYRMNTNDTTKAALEKALNELEDNSKYVNTGWSAHARSVADILVGYNCSRYFSLLNPEVLLTVGRVQTATLGMVVERDRLIENHVKQKYYEVFADLRIQDHEVEGKYEPAKGDPNLDEDKRITDPTYAESKVKMLGVEQLGKVKITEKKADDLPPLPFNLTELQTYCSRKFGYDPTQVLTITQNLRDNHNAITYNRSDCQYLSEEQYKEAPATMQTVIANIGYAPKELDMTLHSKCFDSDKITAHTAIIPQNSKVSLDRLSEQEKNVYLAICKYYMAQFLPPAKKVHTKLYVGLSDGAALVSTSTRIESRGYLAIFKESCDNIKRTELSDIAPGEYDAEIVTADMAASETKPPARYTKASLGKDMTCVSKYVKDPKVKEMLLAKDKGKEGENGSIGTVATRPYIIDKLVSRGFIEEDAKKKLTSTPLGRELIRILPDELKLPDMTGYWWAVQDDIAKGKQPWTALTDSVLESIQKIVKTEYPRVDLRQVPASLRRQRSGGEDGSPSRREPLGICPLCGRSIIEGKFGFGCSGYRDGCKFTVWKKNKYGLLQKEEIVAKDVLTWLEKGWVEDKDVPGKMVTKNSVTFKNLYSPRKNSTFEGQLRLRVNMENGQVDTKLMPFNKSKPKTSGKGKGKKSGGGSLTFTRSPYAKKTAD